MIKAEFQSIGCRLEAKRVRMGLRDVLGRTRTNQTARQESRLVCKASCNAKTIKGRLGLHVRCRRKPSSRIGCRHVLSSFPAALRKHGIGRKMMGRHAMSRNARLSKRRPPPSEIGQLWRRSHNCRPKNRHRSLHRPQSHQSRHSPRNSYAVLFRTSLNR